MDLEYKSNAKNKQKTIQKFVVSTLRSSLTKPMNYHQQSKHLKFCQAMNSWYYTPEHTHAARSPFLTFRHGALIAHAGKSWRKPLANKIKIRKSLQLIYIFALLVNWNGWLRRQDQWSGPPRNLLAAAVHADLCWVSCPGELGELGPA